MKIFLPIYFLLFFGLAMFWRSYIAWKRTGNNPYKLGNGNTVPDFVGKLFRLTLIATVLIVFVFSFLEGYYRWLSPITWMNSSMLMMIGIALLVLALIWVLVAQLKMGDSWRIGIDEKSKSTLVKLGLFGVSRSPIFLGRLVMLVGLLLLLPTPATLTVCVLGLVLIHVRVRLEEAFLAEKYGEDYRKYQVHTLR